MIRVAILLRFPISQLFVAAKGASFPNCAIFDVPCPRIVQGIIKLLGEKRRVSRQKKIHILSEQNYDIKQLFKQFNIFIWENQQEIFSNMTQSLLLLS